MWLMAVEIVGEALPERWTASPAYADEWMDPADDPRETGTELDGERSVLVEYVRLYRLTMEMKCDDLDAEQLARRSVPPSTMSLLGLLRHLAEAERDWRNWISEDGPLPAIYGGPDADFDEAAADETMVDAAYENLKFEQGATDDLLADHPDLSDRLGAKGISVRELLVHRIEEYARHCGHADLLREC